MLFTFLIPSPRTPPPPPQASLLPSAYNFGSAPPRLQYAPTPIDFYVRILPRKPAPPNAQFSHIPLSIPFSPAGTTVSSATSRDPSPFRHCSLQSPQFLVHPADSTTSPQGSHALPSCLKPTRLQRHSMLVSSLTLSKFHILPTSAVVSPLHPL
ncbi:unnamed protein product [Chondrus crispus]|uniref:Uncharacterized protein n=1 Tax=Chondrus crispus TaxID=2769 RepID=R7QIP6_CHOCR|nr:unnamed protein product [Chondrus crispus]CDF37295.1 unnamed protein product [Chondrus crispus]|eukprot:XP_005717114.1 unnamed protein product [Chondrus crispus]